MKKILSTVVLIFALGISNAYAFGNNDLSNQELKPSVASGKIGKSYSIVKAGSGEPVLGKKSYKFVAIPFDCGNDQWGTYTDCGTEYDGYGGGQDRMRSELSGKKWYGSDQWISYSIYIPEDFKSIYPTITSFFQLYEKGKGPSFKMEDDGNGNIIAHLLIHGRPKIPYPFRKTTLMNIDDMKGKWTHIIMNVTMSKHDDKGFYKIWVNDELKVDYKGKTSGSGNKGFYIKAGI